MRLDIFRCRARPRMFGATRYETASNLPTERCSAGWEFYQRVDLTSRDTLRYQVDTAAVRKHIEQRGWHVWDETPLEARQEEKPKKLTPTEDTRSPEVPSGKAEPLPEFQWRVPERVEESSPAPAPVAAPAAAAA